jgi:ABC-type nitrate/sulfonate/bicarbonate transport system substrate-binding protein
MSVAGQPLFIATVNYHIGHTISVRIAEEQGFFRDEGFTAYLFDERGMVPGPFERDALGLVMEERGIDVALGAGTAAALHRCAVDGLRIVGGWRLDGPAGTKWYGAAHLRDLGALRGARVGIRERGSMDEAFLAAALARAGIDAERELVWVCDHIFYGDHPAQLDAIAEGRVDLVPCRPATWAQAEQRGLRMVLDTVADYPAGRPGKVIVATARTVRERRAELIALLRANIRAFWFARDVANFPYVSELDARLRVDSRNDVEHARRLVTSPEVCESWPMPLDGGIARAELAAIVAEEIGRGRLPAGLTVDEVLDDGPVREAYAALTAGPDAQRALAVNRKLIATFGY